MQIPLSLVLSVMHYLIQFGPDVLNLILGKDLFRDSHQQIATDIIDIIIDNKKLFEGFLQGNCIWDKRIQCTYENQPNCWIVLKFAEENIPLRDWNIEDFKKCKYRGKNLSN